jgi:diguanylate cyclase (GGDEF)-like protein
MKANDSIDKVTIESKVKINPPSTEGGINSRKLTTAKFVIYFSLAILIFFTANNYLYENMALFYSNATLLAVVLSTILFFKKRTIFLAHIILMLMAIGILLLVYLNKGQQYVPIWSFVFIYIAMIMYGYQKGLKVVISFCLIVLAMLFVWVGDTVNILEFLRFSSVIMVSILFSYISEHQISSTLVNLANTQQHIEEINKIDGLTNIYNRRQFDVDFIKAINSAKRSQNILAFAMLDIDYFKRYNDTYGHQEGDQALIRVAQQLKHKMQRASDAVYRLGGEEFAVLYQAENSQEAIDNIVDIQHSIEQLHINHSKNEVSNYLTISAGLFLFKPEDNINITEAYKCCDEQLYKAKNSGRNQVKYT